MDLVPCIVTYFWMTPTKEGTYDILCAELCGVGHHNMRGTVVVESREAFDTWLSEQMTFGQLLARNEAAKNIQLADAGATAMTGGRCMATATHPTLSDDLKTFHDPKTLLGQYIWSKDHKVISTEETTSALQSTLRI